MGDKQNNPVKVSGFTTNSQERKDLGSIIFEYDKLNDRLMYKKGIKEEDMNVIKIYTCILEYYCYNKKNLRVFVESRSKNTDFINDLFSKDVIRLDPSRKKYQLDNPMSEEKYKEIIEQLNTNTKLHELLF